MAKYKNIDKKIDEAVELSKGSGKNYGFNVCLSKGEITTTDVQEVGKDFTGKFPETMLGSINPESKNIQPEVQKV